MNDDAAAVQKTDAKWGFTGTLVLGLLISIVFVVVQIIAMIAYLAYNYPQLTESEYRRLLTLIESNGDLLTISTIVTGIICSCLIFGVIKLKKGSDLKSYLGWNKVDSKIARNWLGAMLLLVILSEVLTIMLGRSLVPDFMSEAYATASNPILLWLAIVVVAPVFEELFFRGFLLAGFASSFLRPAGAVLVTSASWALIHLQYDLYGMVTIFVFGLLLGAARLASGSVLLTIGLHAFSNLLSMVETIIKGL